MKLRKATTNCGPWRTFWQQNRLRLRRDLVLVNKQIRLLSLLVKHSQVPLPAKIAGYCAIGYILSPIQLIPSFIPIIGQMDDLLMLYLGTRVVRRFAPSVVLNECTALADSASSAQITCWEQKLSEFLTGHDLNGPRAASGSVISDRGNVSLPGVLSAAASRAERSPSA